MNAKIALGAICMRERVLLRNDIISLFQRLPFLERDWSQENESEKGNKKKIKLNEQKAIIRKRKV